MSEFIPLGEQIEIDEVLAEPTSERVCVFGGDKILLTRAHSSGYIIVEWSTVVWQGREIELLAPSIDNCECAVTFTYVYTKSCTPTDNIQGILFGC